jgi:hypothetical protein
MATKQDDPAVEAPKTPPDPFPAIDKGVDEDGLRWEDVSVFGTTYRVREITVDESDTAFDASQNPDKTFNPRLNQRLELVASVVSPPITIDQIGKWTMVKLRALLYVHDRVNTLPAADAAGNG